MRPAVGVDQWQDDGLMPLEGRDRRGFVFRHQAAIPSDVRHQDGSKPALDMCLVHTYGSSPEATSSIAEKSTH
jgi:hypothetical protein